MSPFWQGGFPPTNLFFGQTYHNLLNAKQSQRKTMASLPVQKVHFSHRLILTSHDTSQAPISGAKTTAKNNVQILDGIDELWDSLM